VRSATCRARICGWSLEYATLPGLVMLLGTGNPGCAARPWAMICNAFGVEDSGIASVAIRTADIEEQGTTRCDGVFPRGFSNGAATPVPCKSCWATKMFERHRSTRMSCRAMPGRFRVLRMRCDGGSERRNRPRGKVTLPRKNVVCPGDSGGQAHSSASTFLRLFTNSRRRMSQTPTRERSRVPARPGTRLVILFSVPVPCASSLPTPGRQSRAIRSTVLAENANKRRSCREFPEYPKMWTFAICVDGNKKQDFE